jgi:dCMP deaminase
MTESAKTRPSFESIYMRMAKEVSRRSTCSRTNSKGELMQVGCIITTPDYRKVLALGYNGNAAGLPNECDSAIPGNCGCIHAEANAVVNCDAPRQTEKVVFCTHLPCVGCAKLLINLGNVNAVYYAQDYRIRESLRLFDKTLIRPGHMVSDDTTPTQARYLAQQALEEWEKKLKETTP